MFPRLFWFLKVRCSNALRARHARALVGFTAFPSRASPSRPFPSVHRTQRCQRLSSLPASPFTHHPSKDQSSLRPALPLPLRLCPLAAQNRTSMLKCGA